MNNHHFEFTEYSDNKERPLNKISLTSSVLKYGEEQQSPDFFDIIISKKVSENKENFASNTSYHSFNSPLADKGEDQSQAKPIGH